MGEIKPIDIFDYSVSFYGGKGLFDKIRTVIALYDKTGKLTAWLRFYDDINQIEKDSIDENGLLCGNFPSSSYLDIIYTLRSNRPVQIILYENVLMLNGFRILPVSPERIDKDKIN